MAAMTPTSLFVLMLAIAPAAGDDAAADPPAPTVDGEVQDAEYRRALTNVQTALDLTNENPGMNTGSLADALVALQDYAPQLATDPKGQQLRTLAQLSYSRLLLAAGHGSEARAAMDEAIRTARGTPLPTNQFGPGLAALGKERGGALAKQGTGSLVVVCTGPCRIYLNERPISGKSIAALIPGRYRLWIESGDRSVAPVRETIEIQANGEVTTLGPQPLVPIDDGPTKPRPGPEQPRRIMPRGAEIALMIGGAVGLGVGGALLAVDGRCPKGADPTDPEACPSVYTTATAGIVTMALGGALLVSGAVTLSVDEVRLGRHENAMADGSQARARRVTVGWSMRF